MKTYLALGLGTLALAACATPGSRSPDYNSCKPEGGMRFIGQKATAASGQRILIATGADRLRWIPPRTAVTMEFAMGRVNVTYDDDYTITMVTCS